MKNQTFVVNMSRQLCSSDCPFAKGIPSCVGVNCVAYTKAREAPERYYKFPDFRPGQLEALLPLLHQRDVFVRMATGSGKSLCMFLGPLAVSDKAIGLVVSPLKALMNQQVLVLCYDHFQIVSRCSMRPHSLPHHLSLDALLPLRPNIPYTK